MSAFPPPSALGPCRGKDKSLDDWGDGLRQACSRRWWSRQAKQDGYHLKQHAFSWENCALLCPPCPDYIYLDDRSGFSLNYWIHRIQLSLKQNPPPLSRAIEEKRYCVIHRWTGDDRSHLKPLERLDTLIMLHKMKLIWKPRKYFHTSYKLSLTSSSDSYKPPQNNWNLNPFIQDNHVNARHQSNWENKYFMVKGTSAITEFSQYKSRSYQWDNWMCDHTLPEPF